MKNKGVLIVLLIFSVLYMGSAPFSVAAVTNQAEISVFVDGLPIVFDVKPVVISYLIDFGY